MPEFLDSMCSGFANALFLYKKSVKDKFGKDSDPWVLFVVEDTERNMLDQKVIEAELQLKAGISSVRATFAEIA